MRIDKFMKVSHLIKRRTVANEVADAGRITVNGKPVKASYAVKEGDVIEVDGHFVHRLLRLFHGHAGNARRHACHRR